MTFKDLKTNYPVYLFDKNMVKLYEGKVTNINAPHIDIKSAGAENQVKDMKSMIETLVNKLNNTSENEQRTEK